MNSNIQMLNNIVTSVNGINIISDMEPVESSDIYTINRLILLSYIAKVLNIDSIIYEGDSEGNSVSIYLEGKRLYISDGWIWWNQYNFLTPEVSIYIKNNLLKNNCRLTSKLYLSLLENKYMCSDEAYYTDFLQETLLNDYNSKYKLD